MRFLKRGSEIARAAADLVLDDDARPAAAPVIETPADPPAAEPAPEAPAAAVAVETPAEAPPANDAGADREASIRTEERKRFSDVFAADCVKGREQAAVLLLTETDMSAERIIAKLPSLGAAGAGANVMLDALRSAETPALGAAAEAGASGSDAKASWNRTFERLGWAEAPKN